MLLVLVVVFALPARGEQQLQQTVLHTLTPIDSMPTKDQLLAIWPPSTVVGELAAIAGNVDLDFGVRLRAIRALPQFCTAACAGTAPHAALVDILTTADTQEKTGKPALLLRAAIESLGATRTSAPADVARLTRFLDHASRDIRAATAFALRDLCDPSAIPYLRNRYNVEMGPTGVPQVRLAISAALRDLGTCSN
jgi:HEAT repeat protein